MKKLIIMLAAVLVLLAACGSSEPHIYDDALVAGDYAVIEADSADVTDEALSDIYFNYFDKQNLEYLIVVYADDHNHGAYMNDSFVLNNAGLDVDANGDIVLGDDAGAVMYLPVDGELKKQ